ncbi:MAG: FAD-binding protein, partial [Alphaproteobacteria bacterium]|nr:FAD-binding protein [Alphaproteobacteria bacterium]
MSKIGKKSKIKNENKAASGSSRRDFLTKGAVAGVGGAAALAGAGATAAQAGDPHHGPTWDREVDVIVIGAGASGLSAANAARDEGVEVMLVEHHFDIGGIAIMSGGDIRIGGGNRLQKEAGIEDSANQVFERWNDPIDGRYNDREMVRRFADENVATFNFLESHQVNFGRHGTTVPEGGRPGGLSGGG